MMRHQPPTMAPADAASLVLRITAARCLDPECFPDDTNEQHLLNAARGILHGAAQGARLAVNSEITIGPFLRSTAQQLASLPSPPSAVSISPNILQASRILDDLAQRLEGPSNNGGSDGATEGCLLELIDVIETHIRNILAAVAGFPTGPSPVIRYGIHLTADDYSLAPFGVTGATDIKPSPREVTIVLKSSDITCRDLLHLTYTVHHELICHAFQAALATVDLPNAHPNCHWTEGWMDTLAFDIVCDWVRSRGQTDTWIPLQGEDAKGELWHFHDHRYSNPRGLKPVDVQRRRRARDAFRQLAETLTWSRVACSAEEAADIVRRFTLNANTHREANCQRLKTLGAQLRIALLSVARPEARLAAALACVRFSEDRDFERLEADIAAASS